MQIALDAIKQMSTGNLESRHVKKYFNIWGTSPWCRNLEVFEDHLASLSDDKIHKALLDNNYNNDID